MNPTKKIDFAMNFLANGQVQQAAQLSSQVLVDAPDSAPAYYLACEVAIAQYKLAQAKDFINQAVMIDDQQPQYLLKKASVELMCRRGLQAQETASAAATRFPDDIAVQLEAAEVFRECGNHAGAEALLLRAGKLEPKNPKFLFEYSTNQFFQGNIDEAEKAISDILDLQLPVKGRKLLLRAQLRKQTPDSNHVESLRNFLAGQLPKTEAVNGYYALARELEDLGEYSQSFEALKSGAAIQRQLVNFNLADELKNISDLIETFQAENFAGIPGSTSEDTPFFIVGMPRTGTTLVERIVSQKKGAKAAEESYDFTLAFSSVINDYMEANQDRDLNPLSAALEVDYNEVAHNYRNNMKGMFGEADCYVDKTPFNFLYCGLIKKAFPKARILHLVREPMDTCYAVFKTLFSKAYYYSYDLSELADYYAAYRRLMDHWHDLMPGAILDVQYEELVSNPLDVSKQIADFVGIEWTDQLIEVQDFDEACSTPSAAQVREPIYTSSVGRWRHLEAQLEPLRQRLAAANIVDATGNPLT
jgi:tetratricopeptide (TPR) repeat protein